MFTEIKALLETSTHPVARSCIKTKEVNLLGIGFKKGMILANHKTPYPSRLWLLEGRVEYRDANGAVVLSALDEFNIVPDVVHEVIALEDSACLLIQNLAKESLQVSNG